MRKRRSKLAHLGRVKVCQNVTPLSVLLLYRTAQRDRAIIKIDDLRGHCVLQRLTQFLQGYEYGLSLLVESALYQKRATPTAVAPPACVAQLLPLLAAAMPPTTAAAPAMKRRLAEASSLSVMVS